MNLLGSSKCPAAKLLLIFAGCDLVGQVLCFCELGVSFREVVTSAGSGANFPGFIATSLHLITRETGSLPLLLTFLYINFQDTNSLSLPRQKSKKLHSLYKQESPERRKASKSRINKEKGKKKKKKGANKSKFPAEDYDDDYGKSKHSFFPNIPPTVTTSTTTTLASRIKNRKRVKSVRSPLRSSPSNNHIKDKKNLPYRRGQNPNRISTSTTAASLASTGSLMGSVILNENEEDTLRRKILEKIEELDPLMCLPKVLCGHSNRSRKKKYSGIKYMTSSTTTSTTNRPVIGEEIIDEYIQLLQIVHPIEKLEEKPQSDIGSKTKDVNKKEDSEEDEENQSESSSSESEEYPKRAKHPSAGLSKEGKIWYTKGEHLTEMKDDEDGDEGEEDDEFEDDETKDEDLLEDMLDEEDMQHIIEREKMKKLMGRSGEFSGESWWDNLDDYKLPFHPQYPHSLKNDISKHSEETSSSWFASIPNMLSNMMPMFSWGGSNKDDDTDDFKHDPFFTSFDGRSLTSRGGRGLSDRWKVPSGTKSKTQRTSRDDIDLEKLFGIRDTKQLDSVLGQDPAEKFRVAVEIGKKLAHPRQCDFIYNGCPLTYEEILAIINEPLKQALGTALTNPIVPAAKKNYTQNFITLPNLQAIVNPQHQFQYHPAAQHIIFQPQPQYQLVHYPAPAHATQIVQYHTPSQPTQIVQYQAPPQPTHLVQYQQYSPPQEPTVDDVSPMIAGKKHKTRIHQALPSGEVEINLSYSESNNAKSGLPTTEILELTNNLTTTQDSASVEDESPFFLSSPSSSSSSISLSVPILESHADEQLPPEHSPSRKPTTTTTDFSSYNFFPSKRYQIRRKGYPKDMPVKDNGESVSTTGSGSSSSSSSFEERHVELNPSLPSKKGVSDIMMKQQRPVAIPFTKAEGKYKYKKLLKQTPTLPPPPRHSANLRNGKSKKNGNKNGKNGSKKKKGSGSISFLKPTKRKKAQLMLQQQKEMLLKKKIRNNKGKHKAHLHKQSSKSNRAKNHHRIAHRDEKYHVYGHPFPPPYAGYYKKRKQKIATTTSPSFFSYIFGR